jgi:uncharacterized protein (TIGR00251 family)
VIREAKAAPAAKLPPFIKSQNGGVLLSVKVQPRASRNEIAGALGDELKIKVTAPPVDSAANEAVINLLAEILRCPKGAIALVRGQTARHKAILIRGLTAGEVAKILALNG